MAPPPIGLNLRVTGYCNQGGRKYMEDVFYVAYQQTEDEQDLEYAFFGIYDGHGGREAAVFAKEHLMAYIVRQKGFWADDDESVLRAIREGFIQTHHAMWKELENWPKTASGLPSTAGTTASVAFIRRGKIYVGHVGDSAIVLGIQHPDIPHVWIPKPLTRDHKPESLEESKRIYQSGGKVVCKSGVPRVVWNRPKVGHKGMVRRSTHIDEIPFLAVARSLGDLWSYNSEEDVFIVSPEPDVYVYPIDITKHRCLILGTDGLWNMLTPAQAVMHVCQAEKSNEHLTLYPSSGRPWINPSKRLVDRAIERWNQQNLRADNTSVVTVMLDPPGPPEDLIMLKRQRVLAMLNRGKTGLMNKQLNPERGTMALVTNTTSPDDDQPDPCPPTPPLPPILPAGSPPFSSLINTHATPSAELEQPSSLLSSSSLPPLLAAATSTAAFCNQPSTSQGLPREPSGLSIISRFPNSRNEEKAKGFNLTDTGKSVSTSSIASTSSHKMTSHSTNQLLRSNSINQVDTTSTVKTSPLTSTRVPLPDFQTSSDRSRRRVLESSSSSSILPLTTASTSSNARLPGGINKISDSTSSVLDRRAADSSSNNNFRQHSRTASLPQLLPALSMPPIPTVPIEEPATTSAGDIQCNEISSSDDDSPTKSAPSAKSSLPAVHPSRKDILKESRLSRELSALQVDNPSLLLRSSTVSRRQRKRSRSANTSDTENEDSNTPRRLRSASGGRHSSRTPAPSQQPHLEPSKVESVELRCQELNAKIRSMERKMSVKAAQLNEEVRLLQSTLLKSASGRSHYLRSQMTPVHSDRSSRRHKSVGNMAVSKTPSPRSLRPRSGTGNTPSTTLRKRKLVTTVSRHGSDAAGAKSPRRSVAVVNSPGSAVAPVEKKPIMTRSKKARVLQLKK